MRRHLFASASWAPVASSLAVLTPALLLGFMMSCGGDSPGLAPVDGDSGVGADGGNTQNDSGSGGNPWDSGNGGNQDGGSRGDGGTNGDGGPQCTPFVGGTPVTGTDKTWTWIEVPEMKCRDKTNKNPTGIGVRLKKGSKKLFIYLQGGGACFNAATCGAGNPSSFASSDFTNWVTTQGGMGIMNDTNAANPVKDWNAVFVPYCSGDVFAGNNPSSNIPANGPQDQMFAGVANIESMLKHIVPTLPAVDQVLLTGSSAGGFGSAVSYERVAKAFCPRPVMLVDDAGPIMSDTYQAPCLQKRFRDVWKLDDALPAGCPNCDDPQTHGGLVNALPYLIRQYPSARFGLLSALQDSTIRLFMSFGENNCQNLDGLPGNYDATKFQNGLIDLRDTYLKPTGFAGTYYVGGSNIQKHTFLVDDGFFSTTVQNVALTDWVAGILQGKAPQQVAP